MSLGSPTPNRNTFLRFGGPSKVLTREQWSIKKHAKDIVPQDGSEHVMTTDGDAWILRLTGAEKAQLLRTDVAEFISETTARLASGIAVVKRWKSPVFLPGIAVADGIIESGILGLQKRVPAGHSWDEANLADDQAAFPPPPDEIEQIIPLDRIVSGAITYPANCPFGFGIKFPTNEIGPDKFCRMYFGGNAEVLPESANGGSYCLELRGGGEARLLEFDAPDAEVPWHLRKSFKWGEPEKDLGSLIVLALIPYGRDRIFFTIPSSVQYPTGKPNLAIETIVGLAQIALSYKGRRQSLYVEDAGHIHLESCTGPGTVRFDIRRDHRGISFINRYHFQPSGTLICDPFQTPELPTGTPLSLTPIGWVPEGTSITGGLYDADTHMPLIVETGNFLSNPSQRRYYAKFVFKSDVDPDHFGEQTPVLWSYEVSAAGEFSEIDVPLTVYTGVKSVSITGPDEEPNHDSAMVETEDLGNALGSVMQRDRTRVRVGVADDDGVVVSYLFEGETVQPIGKLRGAQGYAWPDPLWRDWSVRAAGLWARNEEQFHNGPAKSFASSINSPHPKKDPSGKSPDGYEPWRITDALRWLLNSAGVPDDELDIPDSSLRLWPNGGIGSDDYLVTPGAIYGRMAAELARDYLGWILIRDANAGVRGMWRFLKRPFASTSNALWVFAKDLPPAPGSPRIMTAEGAYGDGISFIQADSWNDYPRAPDANIVRVVGYVETGAGGSQYIAELRNVDSISNPASPDWLEGRRVVETRNDPSLMTIPQIDWVARILYGRIAFHEDWFEMRAPLALVRDASDPLQNPSLLRPLRIYDQILILDQDVLRKAVLKSANPSIEESDTCQWCDYEGRLVT